jgi:hypothetical protein
MNFIYENKIVICLILGAILSYLFYMKDSSENKEEEKKIDIGANLLKGFGIAIGIFSVLYFTDDNDNEVFNYIETGEPSF